MDVVAVIETPASKDNKCKQEDISMEDNSAEPKKLK